MGHKGHRLTKASVETAEWLHSHLKPLEGITVRKMFGGHGVFQNQRMFALIDGSGELFFKATDRNKAIFDAHGAVRHERMPYHSVPATVLEDPNALLEWAKLSIPNQ